MLKRVISRRNKNQTTVTFSPEQVTKMVQEKAYELYAKRGNKPGNSLNDWLTAEKHVRAKIGNF
ncbi:MAG: DUF2934 domain-containing protein [Pseudomonadota bacterium]